MRLAARSNWLWAMALPDIVARGVAVTDGLRGSSEELVEMQSPAGAARCRMLDFGHRVQRVRHALAAGPPLRGVPPHVPVPGGSLSPRAAPHNNHAPPPPLPP